MIGIAVADTMPQSARARPLLQTTDPMALPNAISGRPWSAAIIETESSGAVVASDTSTIPITSFGILKRSASPTELSTKKSAAFARTAKQTSSTTQATSRCVAINVVISAISAFRRSREGTRVLPAECRGGEG